MRLDSLKEFVDERINERMSGSHFMAGRSISISSSCAHFAVGLLVIVVEMDDDDGSRLKRRQDELVEVCLVNLAQNTSIDYQC